MTYTVTRHTGGNIEMVAGFLSGDTYIEQQQTAWIYQDGKRIAGPVHLNCTTLCLPNLPDGKPGIRGVDASDAQIIAAILGDEHIFTGTPSFPEHHDQVTS